MAILIDIAPFKITVVVEYNCRWKVTQSFTLLAYDDDSSAVTSYSLQSSSLLKRFTLSGDSSIEQFQVQKQ